MPISSLTSRTVLAAATALVVLGGCTEGAISPPDDTASATPTTAAPSTASASPSPSPTGPTAQADGCPPASEDRAAQLPSADVVPTTDTRTITTAPSGRQIDVTLVTVSTDGAAGRVADAGAQITSMLEQHVERLIEQWDETAGPPPSESDEEDGGGEAGPPQPELEVVLTPARVDETVVSVVLEGFEYLGGASGNGLIDGWVFSTATGDALTLADVGLDGPCLDELGQLAADALRPGEVGLFEEAEADLRAGEIPMDRWSLHDGSLHLHFPAYELAPGAAGPLTATLDLSEVHEATGTPLGGDG